MPSLSKHERDRPVSRPEESHLQTRSERCVNLSTHTAPIKQTYPSSPIGSARIAKVASQPYLNRNRFVHPPLVDGERFRCLIGFLLFSVERRMLRLDSDPLLQPHYQPSSALTVLSVPGLRLGTLASWLPPLVLLPCHRNDWFLQFHTKARVGFTPPVRRSPLAR